MLKYFLFAILFAHPSYAQEQMTLKDGTTIYPVRADGQRDWQANYYRVDKGDAVPIRPDGHRDWKANIYRPEGGNLVPVRPEGQRDWKTQQGDVKH